MYGMGMFSGPRTQTSAANNMALYQNYNQFLPEFTFGQQG